MVLRNGRTEEKRNRNGTDRSKYNGRISISSKNAAKSSPLTLNTAVAIMKQHDMALRDLIRATHCTTARNTSRGSSTLLAYKIIINTGKYHELVLIAMADNGETCTCYCSSREQNSTNASKKIFAMRKKSGCSRAPSY